MPVHSGAKSFQVQEEKKMSTAILNSAKISFKNKSELKTF